MTPDQLIFGYVFLLLLGLCWVGLYFERRQRRFGAAPSEDQIFRCGKCGYVYTDDPGVSRSRCPGCGRTNDPIQF